MATSDTNFTAIGGGLSIPKNTTAPIQPPHADSWANNTFLIYIVRIVLLGIVLPYTIHVLLQWRRRLQGRRTHNGRREHRSQGHQMPGLPSSEPSSASNPGIGMGVPAVINIEHGSFHLPSLPLQAYHPHSATSAPVLGAGNAIPDARSNTPATFRHAGTIGTQEALVREESHEELGIEDIVEVVIETGELEN